ncbi:uncharacterized protein LY79DRAFT_550665 [Colletotrichum navitas]|uniref:Secreted protein n=1 Tax=Colletotrichum navitas TaxID=681940 RepID=A0AAD8Q1A7_9PEZI|nr:uncharacterized protein LY79DRAFT_550665 [Colletotrichum navitas]KAK1594030.1 hypothetical protein LY79DRAFT_550665 [Colletotrichum navitas]
MQRCSRCGGAPAKCVVAFSLSLSLSLSLSMDKVSRAPKKRGEGKRRWGLSWPLLPSSASEIRSVDCRKETAKGKVVAPLRPPSYLSMFQSRMAPAARDGYVFVQLDRSYPLRVSW